MPKYKVIAVRTQYQRAEYEIEAESEYEARELAWEEIEKTPPEEFDAVDEETQIADIREIPNA